MVQYDEGVHQVAAASPGQDAVTNTADLTILKENGQLPLSHVNATPSTIPEKALSKIQEAINSAEGVEGFLQKGADAFLAVLDSFTGELGLEAIERTRQRRGSAVDKEDVISADRALRDNRPAMMQSWVLAAGSFFGGTSVSAAIALALAPSPIVGAGYWWIAVAVLGIAFVTLLLLGYPRKRR